MFVAKRGLSKQNVDEIKLCIKKSHPSFFGLLFMWTSEYVTDSSMQVTEAGTRAAQF